MPRPIDMTTKIFCVEYRNGLNDGTLRRYVCKAETAKEAVHMAYAALGRSIDIPHTPRVMTRDAATGALRMFESFSGSTGEAQT